MPRTRGNRSEGSVYYDKVNRRWVGTVSETISGKRHRRKVYGRSRSDANVRLRQLKLDLAERRTTIRVDRETVGHYLTEWVGSIELAPSTVMRYRQDIKNHVLTHEIANLQMSEIEPRHVLAFYSDLKGGSKSDSTRRKIHAVLHAAFEAARYSRPSFPRNPTDLPKNNRPKYRPSEEPKPFDAGKEGAFLAAVAGDKFAAMYTLALDAGMRQGELFALEWRDIDWSNTTVEVRRTLKDTETGLDVGVTKGKQRRAIRISSTTLAHLRAHQKEQGRTGLRALVFPDERGGYLRRQNFNRRSFARALAAASEQSGLDFSGHSFHDLRHTMASLLLQEGESITRVSQRLGHANVATTLSYYAHCIPNDEDRPATRFENRDRTIGSEIGSFPEENEVVLKQ